VAAGGLTRPRQAAGRRPLAGASFPSVTILFAAVEGCGELLSYPALAGCVCSNGCVTAQHEQAHCEAVCCTSRCTRCFAHVCVSRRLLPAPQPPPHQTPLPGLCTTWSATSCCGCCAHSRAPTSCARSWPT
jgi:hypothetical protein